MTFPAADLSRLRSSRQTVKVYLAVEEPTAVLLARVSGAHSPGAYEITVSNEQAINEASSYSLDFTCFVGTVPFGSDKGTVRFRGRSDSGTLWRLAYNNISWESGDFLTLVRQVRPWGRLPNPDYVYDPESRTAEVYEDQEFAVGTENENFRPIVRLGPSAAVAFLGSDGLARVKFYQENQSLDNVAITTHNWTFPHGTPATASGTYTKAAPLTVTWSEPGIYLVQYRAVDANGAENWRYCTVYILARDGAHHSADIEVESLNGSYEDGGWVLQARLYEQISGLREGTQVVLFSEQFWNNSEAHNIVHPSEWAYRENILFVGWIHKVRQEIQFDRSSIVIEALGPSGWLKHIASWPAIMTDDPSLPDSWHNIPNMSVARAMLHLLWWHSTIGVLCDLYVPPELYRLQDVDIVEGHLYDQVDPLISETMFARLVGNRYGQLFCYEEQQLLPLDSRVYRHTGITVTTRDIRDTLDLGEQFDVPLLSQIEFWGFSWTGSRNLTTYRSLAPALGLPMGTVEEVQGRQVLTQDETNEIAGMYVARANNPFKDVTLPWAGFLPLDITPNYALYLSLMASENLRGLDWYNVNAGQGGPQTFWIRQVEHDFSHASPLTTLHLERESSGPPGITAEIEDPEIPDPGDPPDPPDPPTPPLPPTPGSAQTVFALYDNFLLRTRDFQSTPPTWEIVVEPSDLSAYHFQDFILDPHNPRNSGWLYGSHGTAGSSGMVIWYSSNIDDDTPTWTRVIDRAMAATLIGNDGASALSVGSSSRNIHASTIHPGFIGFATNIRIGSTYEHNTAFVWSRNYGLDQWYVIQGNVIPRGIGRAPNYSQIPLWFEVSDRLGRYGVNGTVLNETYVFYVGQANGQWRFCEVGWSSYWNAYDGYSEPSNGEGFVPNVVQGYDEIGSVGQIFNPFGGNPSELYLYMISDFQTGDLDSGSGVGQKVFRAYSPDNSNSNGRGYSFEDKTPSNGGHAHGGFVSQYVMTGDLENGLHLLATGNTPNSETHHMYSSDRGETWEIRFTHDQSQSSAFVWYAALGQWPYNANELFLLTRDLGGPIYSLDGGYTWNGKIGNIIELVGATEINFFTIIGVPRQLVPVWV